MKQIHANRTPPITRRTLLKGSGWAVAALGLSKFEGQAQRTADSDSFAISVNAFRQGQGRSWLESFVFSVPELQIQPRAGTLDDVVERERLALQLSDELVQTAVDVIQAKTFPMTLRYPAWLAVGVSLELFELVLENSSLPAFELTGIAREHVLPYTALIDLALIPICDVLRTPGATLSGAGRAQVAEYLELLRGRLVLLADPVFITLAEQLQVAFALVDAPVLLRVFADLLSSEAVPGFQSNYHQNVSAGEMVWRLSATEAEWKKIIRKRDRAIDKVVKSLMVGQLFGRCP